MPTMLRFLLPALLLSLLGLGCGNPRPDRDDDDASVDDDDSGDDDDASPDDDDASPDDDDDASPDDDDASPDDDDDSTPPPNGSSQISGNFRVDYWVDADHTNLLCSQVWAFTAQGTFNPNAMGSDCVICRGRLAVTSAQDVTLTSDQIDEAAGQSRCDLTQHFGGQPAYDFSEALFRTGASPSNPGGDFLEDIGLIPRDVAVANQLVVGTNGSPTIQELVDQAPQGTKLSHLGMYTMTDDMFFRSGTDLTTVAQEPPGCPDGAIFWQFWTTPGNVDTIMEAEYIFASTWTLNFQEPVYYTGLTFSGNLVSTFTPAP